MKPRKQPLSAWLAAIFFEDNTLFRRRASRLGLISKAIRTIPQTIAFVFCNFASTYPRRQATSAPQPTAPAAGVDLEIAEWPLHPGLNTERGLPYSDSIARSINLGDALCGVRDLIFAVKELHRVCLDGSQVRISIAKTDSLPDPTLVRTITRDTVAFFTGSVSDPALIARSRKIGVAGLFALASETADSMTMQAVKNAEAFRPTQIDIGCGTSVQPGYTGIDILPLAGVTIVRDVDNHGLPFSDSSISHVYTAHFLEHTQNFVFIMNEIHRACCHNAIVDINVPVLLGPFAAADPTHRRLFNARTLSYFEAGTGEYAGIVKGFEILEQHVGFSLIARLRVIKTDGDV